MATAETSGPAQLHGHVHVIGAGLAGLAAAVDLAGNGYRVSLYEAGPQAGGRCRSYFDAELGCRIDNGNHLLLSGNTAAFRYVERIGALDTFEAPGEAAIPFVDLADGARWSVRPGNSAIPWWVLRAAHRIPGTRARDYLSALRLRFATAEATVATVLPTDTALFRRLWEPVTVAALNTAAADASARLVWHILTETLGRGAAACRPLLPRDGLSESLVDPALAFLARRGATIRFGARLKALGFAGDSLTELVFDDEAVALTPQDSAIVAVPAAVAARLVPGLVVPDDYAPIVNAHFRYTPPVEVPAFTGVIGGTAEWVFRKRDIVSVTVSAADRIVGLAADELRDMLWRDVAQVYGLPPGGVPPAHIVPARIIKERRATFRATPAQLRRRPVSATKWQNLRVAGDYVETGLPATIEGAIRSGFAAAAGVRQSGLRQTGLRQGRDETSGTHAGPAPVREPPAIVEDCQRALS